MTARTPLHTAAAGLLFAALAAMAAPAAQGPARQEPNLGGSVDLASQDPKVALERMKPAAGYEVSLFASEREFPELANPLAMTFDTRGRLWVITSPTYPHVGPDETPNDKVVILEDTNRDGKADRLTVFADGLYIPTGFALGDGGVYISQQPNLMFLQDTNGDGKADVIAIFEGDKLVRTEQDTNFDGKMDATSRAQADGTQLQEADANGDGKIDTWIVLDAAGQVTEKREDRDGDGKPEVIAKFKDGKPIEVAQGGVGQHFDAAGNVADETRDSDGDGKVDTWLAFEGGKPVREVRDTNADGKPDVLTRVDANGTPVTQELIEGKATRPNKKLFLAADGNVTAQCLDTNGDGKYDARATVEGGQVTQALLDTDGNGQPDQREIYEGGVRTRLEADTNKDKRPDIVQHFQGDAIAQQDEDTNFDGKLDRAFQGTTQVPLGANTAAPAPLGPLDCGPPDPFWSEKR